MGNLALISKTVGISQISYAVEMYHKRNDDPTKVILLRLKKHCLSNRDSDAKVFIIIYIETEKTRFTFAG